MPTKSNASFTANDIMRPEILLSVAAILVLIAGIGGGPSITVIMIALLMGVAAAVPLKLVASPLLERLLPLFSVSAVCGIILLFHGIDALRLSAFGVHWSSVLLLLGGLVSLLVTYLIFSGATPALKQAKM